MVAERLPRRSGKSVLDQSQRAPMARHVASEEGDRRSLKEQLEQDDDVIVLEPGSAAKQDFGAGVTDCLDHNSDELEVGFSKSIPAEQPDKISHKTSRVEFEDVSDPSEDEGTEKSTTARARMAVF